MLMAGAPPHFGRDTALLEHVMYHSLIFHLSSFKEVGVYNGRFLLPKELCDSDARWSSLEAEGGFANSCAQVVNWLPPLQIYV